MGDKNYEAVLSRDEIQKILANDLQSKEFTLLDYKVKPFSENPMGFLGIHYQIITSFKVDGVTKSKRYFAKKIPEDIPSHNTYAKGTKAFFKEIEFYETVVKDVELNLTPSRKPTKWAPKYLYARDYDLLVVEHLCDEGYYMYPERRELDLDHLIASMRAMAAMHAGPMILEQKLMDNKVKHAPKGWSPGEISTLEHVYGHMVFETECNGDPTHPGNRFYEAGFKSQLAIVDLLPNLTKEQKEHIKTLLPDTLRRVFRFVKPSKKFRNTWVHGDLWSNNIMFFDHGNKQLEAVIIDFQLARLVPPGQDVIMFIHQVQSRGFRKEHLKDLLNVYYDAFTKEVEAEGYEIDTILPRAEFDESCRFYYEFALLSQVMFYQMTLSPPRITSKFLSSPELFDLNMLTDRTAMVVETYETDELCRDRVTEVMEELIEFFKLV